MLTPLQILYNWLGNESLSGMFKTPTPTEVLEKIESLYQMEKDHLILAFNSTGECINPEEWFSIVYNGKEPTINQQIDLFPPQKE